jgi:t-SNARE complex subunit (syntaxin)
MSPNELAVQRLTQSGDHFLDRIGQMRQSLEEIDRLIRQMLQIQETILGQTAVRPEDKHQLDGMIEQIQRRATILRQGVRTLEAELASEVDINGVGANARRRIRQNQADQLRRRLNEVIETFHSAQEEYRQRVTSQ